MDDRGLNTCSESFECVYAENMLNIDLFGVDGERWVMKEK